MSPAICRAVAALARGLIGPLEMFAGAMESEAERLDGADLPDFVTVADAARIIGEKRGKVPAVSTLHAWRAEGRFQTADGQEPRLVGKGWLLPRAAVEAVRDGRDGIQATEGAPEGAGARQDATEERRSPVVLPTPARRARGAAAPSLSALAASLHRERGA